MALAPGTRVGPYEILSALGAGGMGEVYRARDGTLNRDVAVKVLPELFALDPDRLARFKRESQVLASLNHPNIAAIYGFEASRGVQALILELVEGPTLADRIACGPVPLDDALPIARQIAEALEAAHEQGIIHRDLKPANIKVREDGTAKVLDFGLAKAVEGERPVADTSNSPTLSLAATNMGVILGTAAYMAPEQAKGKRVDKRADIWAFGVVLFEMLTGARPFDGEDAGDTLAAVLRAEPDWNALPADATFPIKALLRGCLTKDPRQRIADISTALFVLRHQVTGAPVEGSANGAHGRRGELQRRALFTTAALLLGAAVAGTVVWSLTRRAPPAVVRTTVTTSEPTALTPSGTHRDVVITPDGSRIVYRGNNQLLVRALNQLEPTALRGLGVGLAGPGSVFISPDGQWVGFFDGATIKKVAITGGRAVPLCFAQGNPRGATWSGETIVFAADSLATGLLRVSAAGGEPTVLTKPDRERGEGDHLWPEFLPGGAAVLFTITPADGPIDDAQIALLDLQTHTVKVLINGGSHAHYVPTGHLVYGVTGAIHAVAFDLARLEVVGTPAPVLEQVATTSQGAADFAVAGNGSLVYLPGGAGGAGQQTIVAVDRQGRPSPLPGLPPDSYRDIRVSPDGAQLALATVADVWTYDFARATLSRLTTNPAPDTRPLWTPDGQRIIFMSRRAGYPELFWRPADGTGNDERLLARAKDLIDLRANGWSADGRQLLFSEVSPRLDGAIGQIAVERPSDTIVLLERAYRAAYAAISPNGRWMAYNSSVSGQAEVYVERYPELGNRQQISTGGGRIPLWSRDGRELFFITPDNRQILAVPVQAGTTLVAGRPQVLFEFSLFVAGGSQPYDIGPDGRFLMIRSGEAQAGAGLANLIVVQNWFEELKRLVPGN
jgi:DNA-binding beta-propeller fold protein YncE